VQSFRTRSTSRADEIQDTSPHKPDEVSAAIVECRGNGDAGSPSELACNDRSPNSQGASGRWFQGKHLKIKRDAGGAQACAAELH
jgi:hypothetical protein